MVCTTNLLTPIESVKAMLHGTIGNEDLQRSRAMQHYCDIFFEWLNIVPILPPLLNRYTQDNNVHIWARGPAKPPCRLFNIYADMYKYQVLSINERTEAPKPDTKTPKNQQVEKTRGTCTPDQGSGATLGVLGYASA